MYPGGAAAIPHFESLLHQIIIGKGITELVLMTHDDCAGCELLGITQPAGAMLREAEKLLRAFPGLMITCYHKHLINDGWMPVKMEATMKAA